MASSSNPADDRSRPQSTAGTNGAFDDSPFIKTVLQPQEKLQQPDESNRSGSELPSPDSLNADPFDVATVTNVKVSPVSQEKRGAPIREIGDYEILNEIARGGMGVVYLARQKRLNRLVAVKMILAGQLASVSDVKRFYAEAESAAKLEHPHIVPIHEVGEHNGQHYFSMGYVDGPSLSKLLQDGPLDSRDAADLLAKIADAVQYAHEQGIIHRDLKPANVLLQRIEGRGTKSDADTTRLSASHRSSVRSGIATKSGTKGSSISQGKQAKHLSDDEAFGYLPKVTDFGLAKQTEADSGMTSSGQIVGTPSYMPPEQAAGRIREISPASDVYSLGAILYETLAGRPPFRAASVVQTLRQVLEQEPVKLRLLNPNIDRDLETICLKCLEKPAERRYGSAGELADDLRRFLNGEPVHARPVGPVVRVWRWCKRKPLVVGSIVAAMLAIVALSIAWEYRRAANRATQLGALQQAFTSGLDDLTLEATSLRPLEASIAAIETFDSKAAKEARTKLTERFLALLEKQIKQPRLTDAERTRLDAGIELLATRDADAAQRLRTEFKKRLGGWEIATELIAPFDGLSESMPKGRVSIVNERLKAGKLSSVRLPGELEASEPPVRTLIRAEGSVRCELMFDSDWETARRLGVTLGDPKLGTHQVRLIASEATKQTDADDGSFLSSRSKSSSPEVAANDVTKSEGSSKPSEAAGDAVADDLDIAPALRGTFASARARGERVVLELRRGPLVLQQVELLASQLGTGPLRLFLERDGTRLSVRLNDLDPVRFDDLLPPELPESPALSLDWPSTVSLVNLRVSKRLATDSNNPLQRADDYFVKRAWAEAERLYQELSGGDINAETQREAQFKRGLCLRELGRPDEAAALFEQLMAVEDDRISPAAGCQLWLVRLEQKKGDDADAVFELLQARYRPEQLSRLITAETRDRIVRQNMRHFEDVDQIFRLNSEQVRDLERVAAIDRLLSPSGRGTLKVQIELHRVYRFADRLEDALKVLENASNPVEHGEDRLFLRHKARVLRQLGRPRDALKVVADWFAEYQNEPNVLFDELRIEAARAYILLEEWSLAEREVDAIMITGGRLGWGADSLSGAALMKGFLLERRGAGREAAQVWRDNLRRVREHEHPPRVSSAGFIDQLILGSLADQPMQPEAEKILSALGQFGGLGPVAALIRAAVSSASMADSLQHMWQTPRGREWARKYAYDQVTMRQRLHIPLLVFGSEFLRRNAFGAATDSAHESLSWELADRVLDGVLVSGSLKSGQIVQMGVSWKGSFGLLGWQTLAPTLDERTRALSAVVLGHRALRLNQPGPAEDLLKLAASLKSAHEAAAGVAESDLGLLSGKQGVVSIESDWPEPLTVIFEGDNTEPKSLPLAANGRSELRLPVGKYRVKLDHRPDAPANGDATGDGSANNGKSAGKQNDQDGEQSVSSRTGRAADVKNVRLTPATLSVSPATRIAAKAAWLWKPSDDVGQTGLVARPAKLPNLGRWQLLWSMTTITAGPVLRPDGLEGIFAGTDGFLRWFDPADGRTTAVLPIGDWPMNSIAWSPDGKWIAVGGFDQRVSLIDAKRRTLRWSLPARHDVHAIVWNSRGDRLLVGGWHELLVLDEFGRTVKRVHADQPIARATWSSTDDWIATAVHGGHEITIWSWPKCEPVRRLTWDKPALQYLTASPDGRWLTAVGDGEALRIWDATDWRLAHDNPSGPSQFLDVKWHPRGEWLAVASNQDGRFFRWDDGKLEPQPTLPNLKSPWFAVSPDGKRLVSRNHSRRLQLVELEAQKIQEIQIEFQTAGALDWSPALDSQRLAFGLPDGTIGIWNSSAETVERKWEGIGYVHAVRWAPDGKLLAAAADSGLLRICRPDLSVTADARDLGFNPFAIAWHPDSSQLAVCGSAKTVRLWHADGRAGATLTADGAERLHSIDWSPDGKELIAVGLPGKLWRWNIDTGAAQTIDLPSRNESLQVLWSPRGDRLAIAHREFLLVFRATGEQVANQRLPSGTHSVSWSQDGRSVFVPLWQRGVSIWTNGAIERNWPHDQLYIRTGALSRDDRRLAMSSEPGLIRQWSPRDGVANDTLLAANFARTAILTAGGERRFLSDKLDSSLIYTLEQPDGSWRVLTVAEFDKLVSDSWKK